MAIDSTEKSGQALTKSSCSKSSNKISRRVVNYTADESNSSYDSKYDTSKKKKKISPYLAEDRLEVLSRITEKRLMRKKTTDFVSSYPLAVNIYKASSDEFKALKKSKKVKKSVLTLPNEPAPLTQTYTVSDMNESEYFDDGKDKIKPKPKRMRAIQPNRKPRITKAMEVFDRDAEYCSRLNIDLDRSSTDLIHQFTGDGKKVSTKRRYNKPNKSDANPHDVWAMLRNMNRFPYKASPPLSADSLASIKKNSYNNRINNKMNTKFIETRTTEEFTYFSSLVDKSTHSQSSIDRITVIDKENEYREFHEEVKVLNNKIPTKVKNRQNTKKVKGIAREKRASVKTADSEKKNEKQTNEKDVNSKMKIEISNNVKSFRNNIQSRCNSPNSGCTNNCFYCQNSFSDKNKEFKNSDDLLNLCGNSDSSNADIIKNDTCTKMSSCDSQVPIIGITRVVLSKGDNVLLTEKNNYLPKTKLTTSASSHPKLTVTDIRRRLANIKFPLVILGRDQLTSAPFPVTDYTPPHFAALNEHIWPFMQNWQKNNDNALSNCNKRLNPVLRTTKCMVGVLGNNNDSCSNNNVKNSIAIRNKNIAQSNLITNAENDVKPPKTKPIRQFKERMSQFSHKNPSFDGDNMRYSTQKFPKPRDIYNHIDVATNTQHTLAVEKYHDEIIPKREDKMLKCISSNTTNPCTKGRWASDFIDIVIKKIRSGIYYNQDEKESPGFRNCKTREESVQTEVNVFKNDLCVNCINKLNSEIEDSKTIECDDVSTIPGFDDSLSDLQIETISRYTIAVKHCVTNIIVQFDVAIPSEINNVVHLSQSVSCVPISVTESYAKIFKSKTPIVNAILPAEICSILPKTLKKIIGSKLLLPKMVDIEQSHLSPVVELPQFESGNSMKHLIPVHISGSQLRRLGQGNFAKYDMPKITTEITSNITSKLTVRPYSFEEFCSEKITVFLPKFGRNLLKSCHILQIAAIRVLENNRSRNQEPEKENKLLQPKINCMALQSYSLHNKRVAPTFKLNFIDFIITVLSNSVFSVQISMALKTSLNGLNSLKSIPIIAMRWELEENKRNYVISNVSGHVYNNLQNKIIQPSSYSKKQKPLTHDKYRSSSHLNKFENRKSGFEYTTNIRNKKSSYVKLYRKCKSMSSISNERSNIALSKIINLEDFFVALGSAKCLATILDGNTERNILTSIKEMKNWISDITPRQALLVLLLANKKDTSSLVRYRPIILQGIAVKRITRASELDMEIEVIEKENLNTFSQYEGISYLPASIENQDTLLDELCWIAKTTASDYQKPFDESSERLLKSLLEKRKKLNPSYLRVMARYVGLGLLKSPKAT